MLSITSAFRPLMATMIAMLCLSACSRSMQGEHPDFASLVERVTPSVVNISTIAARAPSAAPDQAYDYENAPEWFKRFMDEHGLDDGAPGDSAPDAEVAQSLGSGFVLWSDGYVLTNYHVVREAREIIVRLLDRSEYSAEIVGFDERSDLALLKIDAENLPAAILGDSTHLRPGQWVLAIGSPFGFDYSVTAGIISAKGRSLYSEQYVPFIQTDVAINPGNSGGPLFNLDGEVIGINSQIYSQSGSYQGVSFSIPIDVAAKVARQLKQHRRVTRGWLGVVVQEVNRQLAQNFGMHKPIGALVARVVPGSPAESAGLRAGDIILTYEGQELSLSTALPPLVGNSDPGDIITLEVLREGKPIVFKVEIGLLENQDQELGAAPALPPPPAPSAPYDSTEPVLGLSVVGMTEEERRAAKIFTEAVTVVDVLPGPAARAGIRPGDVILSVAGQSVGSADRFAEVAGRLTPGSSAPLLVSRDGIATFIPVAVPALATP